VDRSKSQAVNAVEKQVKTASLDVSISHSIQTSPFTHFNRDRVSFFALITLAVIVLLSLSASWISTTFLHTDPFELNLLNILQPWFSPNHILGTDELGRDELTRILFAGRISLAIGFSVAFFQSTIGVSLGLIAGYYGGLIDDLVNGLLQVVRGIPTFFLLISLSVLLPHNLINLIIMLSFLGWPGTCRQVRGLVLSIKQTNYIEASRAIGASDTHILIRHILPNISSIVLIMGSFDIAGAIITESSLSFLGFGVQSPIPSWGNMLKNALNNVSVAPWLIATPGIFISITVLCIFLVADGLRDAFDPHLAHNGESDTSKRDDKQK
jgi:peptide/nickel transport system permease protein